LGKKVALFIEGDRIEIQQHLISALSNTLSKYEIPKEIIYISNFTYTGSGKINREETSKFLF
jgi:O-succinylbenzoic acid--CoA ligase